MLDRVDSRQTWFTEDREGQYGLEIHREGITRMYEPNETVLKYRKQHILN